MLNNFKVGVKLNLLIGVFVTGLIGFGALAFYTLTQVEVGGPVYGEIVEGKDLVADILPPPAYILETYFNIVDLESLVVAGAPRADMQEHIDALARLEQEFGARMVYWEENLPDENGLRQALLDDARRPAEQLYAVVNDAFYALPSRRAMPRRCCGSATSRSSRSISSIARRSIRSWR